MNARQSHDNYTNKVCIVAAAEAEQTGQIVDRNGFYSGLYYINAAGTMALNETATATVVLEHSENSNMSSATSVTLQNAVVAFTADAGEAKVFSSEGSLDLSGYGRYLRLKVTLATSSGTDNLTYSAGLILSDAKDKPVTHTFAN
jgi:hypothetical protein